MSGVARKALEREADRLGIPWTYATDDDYLRALIDRRVNDESGDTMVKIDVRTDEKGHRWIGDMEQPDCYGLYWDEVECAECLFQAYCVDHFVKNYFRDVIRTHQSMGDADLAESLGISEGSVKKARAMLDSIIEKEKEPEPKAEESAKKEKINSQKEPPRPPQAGSANRVKDPAGSLNSEEKSARSVEAPAEKRRKRGVVRKWSREHDRNRWERERKRSRLIAALEPGMVLTKEYKGETYQVTVLDQGYEYRGEIYPTLYSVTKEITGTVECPRQKIEGERPGGTRKLCSWSAPKFWQLRKRPGDGG